MTEKEVLGKLEVFKQAIQKLKDERDYWKEQAEENPKEACELENLKDELKYLSNKHSEDLEKINELEIKCREFSDDFTDADLECDRLKAEIDRADSAYAKLAKMYGEFKAELDSMKVDANKKYTEEDLKKLLHKAAEKSKTKIQELETSNKTWEEQFYALQVKYENLELANKSLENSLKEKEAQEEIDKVLENQMTDKEMDEILHKNSQDAQELTNQKKVLTLAV